MTCPTGSPGGFLYKVWTPVNFPVNDGRKTVVVLHQTQDVTRVVPPVAGHVAAPGLAELRKTADALGFPEPRPAESDIKTVSRKKAPARY